ncbi:collagen alpha-1(XII) chain-like [Biomphalaria glabrata]|uniref:Collagen alpha-1(XII) chain-like n=2 Tax=Biomphalaria glabrata TaxID=6526 RepID=A0A9W2YAM3_BIOGL|nr:collagen alpha-1(XII) chain-like [Biomphalaria glabrata]
MNIFNVMCLAFLLTQANGLLLGNVVEKVLNTGVQTTNTIFHKIWCAWLGKLIPCKEMPGEHGSSAPLPTRCDAIADILTIVDASSSIGRNNFDKVLSLLANMAASFKLGPDRVRFSCVVFSDRASIWFKLNDYNTIEAVQKAFLKAPYFGGATYTDKALSLIRNNNLFGSAAGGRANAPDIGVLFTDGQSTNPLQTRISANLLKSEGVKMFSVGITNNVNDAELRGVSSGPEYVFRAKNFDDLADKLAIIVNKTCEASNGVPETPEETEPPTTESTTTSTTTTTTKTKPPTTEGTTASTTTKRTTTTTKAPPPEVIPCRNITKADIMIVEDASTSIGQANWNIQTRFAADVANAFTVGPNDVLFAALIFNRNVTRNFNFNTYTNKADVVKALLSIVYPYNPGTYTHLAFSEIRTKNLFGTQWGGREDSKKVVIVLTDGQSAYPDKTITESQLLRDTGVLIISVGIGVTNTAELEAMASKPEYVFTTGSYETLDYIKNDLVQLACKN